MKRAAFLLTPARTGDDPRPRTATKFLAGRLVRICAVAVLVALALFLMPKPAAAFTCTSNSTGTSWNTASHWTGCNSTVPQAGDTVIIATATTVDVSTNAIASLTINTGQILTVGNSTTARTVTVSGTVTITGTLTPNDPGSGVTHSLLIGGGGSFTNNGTFTGNNNGNGILAVTLNGNAAQSIDGSSTTTFESLTLTPSVAATTISATTNFNLNGTFTVNANAVFSPGATVQINNGVSTSNTITGTGKILVTRIAATADYNNQYNFATDTLSSMTVEFAGAGNQTINAFTFGSLTTSGSGTKSPDGAYTVNSTLTVGSGTTLDENLRTATLPGGATLVVDGTLDFTNTAGLIQSGTSGTTTLTMGSTGLIRTLDSAGLGPAAGASLVTQAGGAWTVTSISTNGTIEYNRNVTSGQVVTDRDYNNLTITGSTQTKTWTIAATRTVNGNVTINASAPLTLSGAQTVNVNGNWANSGTFVPGTGTINFNGTTTISGSSTNSFNNLTITGSLTAPAANMNVGGNWTNNGTFTASSGTVTFNGSAAQTIGGSAATAFSGLTINNSAGVTLNTSGSVGASNGILTLTTDLTVPDPIILTHTGTGVPTGVGDVVGDVRRTDVNGTAKSFGNVNVQIANGGTATQVDVNLAKGAPGGFAAAILRGYSIVETGGTVSGATVRLHYLDSELNSNAEGSLTLWRATAPAGTWQDQSFNSRDTTANWVEKTSVDGFSEWTLASPPSAPTAVKLTSFTATQTSTQNGDEVMLQWRTGYEARNLGYNIYREQNGKRVAITPSLVAGSALIAGRQTRLTAGSTYTWYDQVPEVREQKSEDRGQRSEVTYWLEDVDLNGTRTLHGPIAPTVVYSLPKQGGKWMRADLISEMTRDMRAGRTRSRVTGVEFNGWPAGFARQQAAPVGMRRGKPTPISLTQREIAGMPGVKIAISKPGWYRVTRAELVAAGLDKEVVASRLQLYVNATEVAINISGTMRNDGDYLEFYGQGLDSPTETAQTYYLVAAKTNGKRIASRSDGRIGEPAGALSFDYTVERKERMIYFSGLLNGDTENFFGQIVTTTPATGTLPVSHLDPGSVAAGTPAQLEVALQGVTNQSHLVRVRFNGTDLGTINFANTEHPRQTFAVPAAALHDGDNTVELGSLGGAADVNLVDTLRLTYARLYEADNNALAITLNSADSKRISGFTNSQIRAMDVTNPNQVTQLKIFVSEGKEGTYTADVQMDASSANARTLLVFADDALAHPAGLKSNEPSAWWSSRPGYDYLIISSRDLVANVEPLAQLRRNQGLTVGVIDVEDLYDEFSFGRHSPQGIRDFLGTAMTTWQRQPHYLLLAGDASYDPKNYFGQGLNDLVPTKLIDTSLMEAASDDWLADFNADGIADLAIGRLPLRTAADINAMVGKIVNYENTAPDPTRGALLVADTSFEAPSSAVQSLLPAGMAVETINRGSTDDATVHNQIIAGLNRGPRVANYFGHGSNGVWTGASLLSSDDAPALTNTNRLSVFTMMTCFNGFFQDAYNDSLSEALLKSQGGAVAVWASTTLTDPGAQNVIDLEFYRLLFGAQPATLGDASRAAKATTGDADVRRTWTLFGDPAMRLR